ncbi:sialate O-acetylesterase [Haloferula sp. BvORR071]|uniref:sialate O-acetylesterase n=1 Tax=Haloferula sp. BvORR071 TaxID=1396141 RepID=UPI0006979411|nr:sialate O-acetylesterase [Haloferula sp. BvORR071]
MIRPLILALAAVVLPAAAEVRLPKVFTTGAVLQRDRPVPVWGWATPGKKVTVKFAGQEKSTEAKPDSTWQLELDPLPASAESRSIEVAEDGGNQLEFKDVLVGEVWLASGQSNMELAVNGARQEDQDLAKSGQTPLLRLLTVPKKVSPYRLNDFEGSWQQSTPENTAKFSAVAYFFGRRLTEELGVPVGIIHSSWGGSRIEPWFADEGFDGIEDLQEMREFRNARTPGTQKYDDAMRRHLAATRSWVDNAERALAEKKSLPAQPAAPPMLQVGSNQALGTYQAMIHPLVPYALRGFLWYQGESNVGEDLLYTLKMEALIKGWRKQFNVPDAPFYYVQLAPYNYGDNRQGALQGLWIAQQEALKIPHTGMAVTMDIGNPGDIHPKNKSEVGRRLSLWALADTYGKQGIVKSGPMFESYEATGDTIRIHFKSAPTGLATRDQKAPDLFEVAGPDWNFKPATAEIAGNEPVIILKSAEVQQPTMARFAWSQTAEPNLMNKEGLPAAAFHTHWPDEPGMGRNVARQRPFTSSDPNRSGWDSGLTDGNWWSGAGTCFATGASDQFPKYVTIDLGRSRPVQAVRFGVPGFGSTKTVVISLSEDGKEFQEAGKQEFAGKTETRKELRFDKRNARFVRATFPDHHERQDNYSENHSFLSELEVYGPAN